MADLTGWRLNATGHSAERERVTPEEWMKTQRVPVPFDFYDGERALAFDEDQPRNPPGTPGGGRWRKVGGGVKNALGYTPISCGGDLDKACRLIAEGKAVELEQPEELATLLDKIGEMVADAKKKGKKAPNYNLCKVSIKGSNLFCHDSKGIPRIQMPQLKGKPTKGSKADKLPRDDRGEVNLGALFKKHLESRGVKFHNESVRADHLKATQNELNGAKVAGMTKFLDTGADFDPESLFVSSDLYIVDGHHRWASKTAFDLEDNESGDIYMDVWRADIGIGSLLWEANKFAEEMGIPQAGVTAAFWGAIFAEYDPTQPRNPPGTPGGGRWRKVPSFGGLPSLFQGDKRKLFLDPYHTSPETAASPLFKPLPSPRELVRRKGESDIDYKERVRQEARAKMGQAPILLADQIEGELRGLGTGEDHRFPEGTLVACNASGDGQHFRIDGPDGTFWRVPAKDAAKLTEFEETTARANRFGETIPGNPMVPLPGVDVPPEDPIADQIGQVLHGGYAPLPRGTVVHRLPGDPGEGDTFELTSPTGTVVRIPATNKKKIIDAARDMERKAEGKDGGDPDKLPKPKRTTEATNPYGPLQPVSPRFVETRTALHAESERVLGYAHGGNEIALIQTDDGFGTPSYRDIDGVTTRMRVEGTDTVLEKDGVEVARDPLPSNVDSVAARDLANFYALADKMEREVQDAGIDPGDAVDRRFNAPILWPEHFDIAVEVGKGDAKNPGSRAVFGASPGDAAHPEPYFYVNPWAKKEHDETWNATGFNGAILTYADVLASPDQEKTIREFYASHMKLLGADQPKPPTMGKKEALSDYTSTWNEIVNANLRNQPHPPWLRKLSGAEGERPKQIIAALDKAIAEGPLVSKRPTATLYRGVDLDMAPGLKGKLHKGSKFSDGAFLSTTDNEEIAHNFASGISDEADPIVMKLKVPGDTHNVPVSDYDESEHILPRGGSFEVTSEPYWTKYFGIDIQIVDAIWHPSAVWSPSV